MTHDTEDQADNTSPPPQSWVARVTDGYAKQASALDTALLRAEAGKADVRYYKALRRSDIGSAMEERFRGFGAALTRFAAGEFSWCKWIQILVSRHAALRHWIFAQVAARFIANRFLMVSFTCPSRGPNLR
jgi:hypothetical protein